MYQSLSVGDRIKACFNGLIDFISFDEEINSIVEKLNQAYEEPVFKPEPRFPSHPGGYQREFGTRRLSVGEAFVVILKSRNPELYETRLDALRTIVGQSLHARTVNMPLNTARIQMLLMKEAVNAYGNRRLQKEYISDFSKASFGNETVIREFLKEKGLIEVPEEGKSLKQLGLGWDDHVHDSLSEGRKAPSLVLIDAFIRGLSRITLVYNNIEEPRIITEALEAGDILGIAVEIGIEFSVGSGGERRHYMYVPPVFAKSKDFFAFLKEHEENLSEFRAGLHKNVLSRNETIHSIVQQFNEVHLPKINETYTPDSSCWFAPLKEDELDRVVASGQPSRQHLTELLFERFKSVYYNRVLYLKAQARSAQERYTHGSFSRWELDSVINRYRECRSLYVNLNRNELSTAYLAPRSTVDYNSSFSDEEVVFNMLKGLPGKVVLINPLELGLKRSMTCVLENIDYITNIETMNLRECSSRNPNDSIVFNRFIYLLNNGTESELKSFLEQYEIIDVSSEKIKHAFDVTSERKLVPNCGSDSTGRSSVVPGMGFIQSSKLTPEVKKSVLERHVELPKPIGELIINEGCITPKKKSGRHKKDEEKSIICLGTQQKQSLNQIGDEVKVDLIGFKKFWHYLNPSVKNLIMLVIGFVFAQYWMYKVQFAGHEHILRISLIYSVIWLSITFFRNILVDLIASAGLDVKRWSTKNLNFYNAYQSLLWTGVSVPVLGVVKQYVDLIWTGPQEGYLFEGFQFLMLCLANGIFIVMHNKLRQFDAGVIKVNFFRSVLAWPFATVFAPFLTAIPAIVQSKIWSDLVGGFIEGGAKYVQHYVVLKRDVIEILPKLNSEDRNEVTAAMLDILYIWGRAPRGTNCLKLLLLNKPTLGEMIWKKGQTAEEKARRTMRSQKEYKHLIELFKNESALDNMIEFALKNYQGRYALELINLIGSEADDFVFWLKELGKSMPKLDEGIKMQVAV